MAGGPVEAWRVHDTGLVAVPSRFRRLRGAVRHHQGQGTPWPARVVLEVVADRLHVTADGGELGFWPLAEVSVQRAGDGPPVTFVVEVPGGAHLLAAPAGDRTEALLAAVSRP